MTANIGAICLANALMLCVGAGLLPVFHLANSRRLLIVRLPLAYAIGTAATGIVASELAVVDVSVGRVGLPILAAASLALGYRRRRGPALALPPRLSRRELVPVAVLLAGSVAFLANAARFFAVKPLVENDGWALWGLRARALYDFGHPVAPVFTSNLYPGLQYPLFVPELEAIDFRFMGMFDGTLIHLQMLGFAIVFVGGAWSLLRSSAPPVLLAASLLAIVTAPAFFGQLGTNEADIPLAIFTGLGVAALCAWLRSGEPGLLPAAALFLVAGALTKNEGELFALAAYIAAFAYARRSQIRGLIAAAAATVVLDWPWHIWLIAHGVTATAFSLSRLLHPSYLTSHWYRVQSAEHQLLAHVRLWSDWSFVQILAIAVLIVALGLRHFRSVAFGVTWLVLAFAGLLCVYWSSPLPLYPDLFNSAHRTIDTLVIGAPLLAAVAFGSAPRRNPGV